MCVYDEVWAVPGEQSIIDTIHSETGLTSVYQQDSDVVLQRYPNAVRMSFKDWQAAASARQHTPLTWESTTAEQYHEMLNCLPPAYWAEDAAFLVGEPSDHDFSTGRPRYQAYWYRAGSDVYLASSRPVTIAEMRKEMGG